MKLKYRRILYALLTIILIASISYAKVGVKFNKPPVDVNNPSMVTAAKAAQEVSPVKTTGEPGFVGVYESNGTDSNIYGVKGPSNITTNIIELPPDTLPTNGQTKVYGTPVVRSASGNLSAHTELSFTYGAGTGGGSVAITEVVSEPDMASMNVGDAVVCRTNGDFYYRGLFGGYHIAGEYLLIQTTPTMVSAVVQPSGDRVHVTFSEAMLIGENGSAGWTLDTPDIPMTYFDGDGTNTIIFSVASKVLSTDNPTISYTQPTHGWATDDDGVDLVSISNASVTNNSTQTAGVACVGNYGVETTGGSITNSHNGKILAVRVPISCAGTMTGISFYTDYISDAGAEIEFGLYADNGSGTNPGALIGNYGPRFNAARNGIPGWETDIISQYIGIVDYVWIAVAFENNLSQAFYATGTVLSRLMSSTFGTWPTNWDTATDTEYTDRDWKLYGTF